MLLVACSFRRRSSLLAAMNHLSGTMLDGRVIRIEVDKGFREGRQYGRGASGGQVRANRVDWQSRCRPCDAVYAAALNRFVTAFGRSLTRAVVASVRWRWTVTGTRRQRLLKRLCRGAGSSSRPTHTDGVATGAAAAVAAAIVAATLIIVVEVVILTVTGIVIETETETETEIVTETETEIEIEIGIETAIEIEIVIATEIAVGSALAGWTLRGGRRGHAHPHGHARGHARRDVVQDLQAAAVVAAAAAVPSKRAPSTFYDTIQHEHLEVDESAVDADANLPPPALPPRMYRGSLMSPIWTP
jgi:hypothetical protein